LSLWQKLGKNQDEDPRKEKALRAKKKGGHDPLTEKKKKSVVLLSAPEEKQPAAHPREVPLGTKEKKRKKTSSTRKGKHRGLSAKSHLASLTKRSGSRGSWRKEKKGRCAPTKKKKKRRGLCGPRVGEKRQTPDHQGLAT